MSIALRCLLACVLLSGLSAPARAEQLRVGAQLRTYTAIVPAQARGLPLVLVLHGNLQQGQDMRERTSWPQVAVRHGFVAVFPDGLNRSWADLRTAQERGGKSPPAGTDDVAFLLALVDHYVAAGIADPKRVYVTGVSNGGAMTLTLACQHPERFAAVASIAMEFTKTVAAACRPSQPVPVLMMNGTADTLIPYAGGRFHNRREGADYLSTPDTLAFWRHANGCDAKDARVEAMPDVDGNDYSRISRVESRCPAGHEVLLYRVDGGGHRIPDTMADAKHPRLVDALLGPQNRDTSGPELIWDFFASHPAH